MSSWPSSSDDISSSSSSKSIPSSRARAISCFSFLFSNLFIKNESYKSTLSYMSHWYEVDLSHLNYYLHLLHQIHSLNLLSLSYSLYKWNSRISSETTSVLWQTRSNRKWNISTTIYTSTITFYKIIWLFTTTIMKCQFFPFLYFSICNKN